MTPAARPAGAQLVIFDCDGVLVDSERLSHEVLRQMLAELGVQLSLEAAYERFMGSSFGTCLQRIGQLLGRPAPEDFEQAFSARSFAAFREALCPVPGVPELLATLGRPYCVASNGPRKKMQLTLGHTGLLPLFEARMFSAEDVARPKPAPDLFLHAARSLATAPEHCVVVEDSPTGITAARTAGMRVLGYAAMSSSSRLLDAGAHAVFTRMAELPALLEG